jgi:hypothetical protein
MVEECRYEPVTIRLLLLSVVISPKYSMSSPPSDMAQFHKGNCPKDRDWQTKNATIRIPSFFIM